MLIKGGTIGAQSERYAPENRDVLQRPKPALANDIDQAQKGRRECDVVIHANQAAILLGSRIKLSTLALGGAQRLLDEDMLVSRQAFQRPNCVALWRQKDMHRIGLGLPKHFIERGESSRFRTPGHPLRLRVVDIRYAHQPDTRNCCENL